jgi:Zn-dependent peptidase ImmA (M78 family)
MNQFARGFKKDCERIVTTLREELRVSDLDPIDLMALADHLEIPLAPLRDYVQRSQIACSPIHIREIYEKVSAFTVFEGRHRSVVYNEGHRLPRHRSNLAHELAHALLLHPPEGNIDRARERLHEREAAWLGGVLLLTDKQAFHVAASGLAPDAAASRFSISLEMLAFRLNVTAAVKRARYAGFAA